MRQRFIGAAIVLLAAERNRRAPSSLRLGFPKRPRNDIIARTSFSGARPITIVASSQGFPSIFWNMRA